MDEQHTPEAATNFVFYLIYLMVSSYISLLILCIGIILISNIDSCYLHCLDFI